MTNDTNDPTMLNQAIDLLRRYTELCDDMAQLADELPTKDLRIAAVAVHRELRGLDMPDRCFATLLGKLVWHEA